MRDKILPEWRAQILGEALGIETELVHELHERGALETIYGNPTLANENTIPAWIGRCR